MDLSPGAVGEGGGGREDGGGGGGDGLFFFCVFNLFVFCSVSVRSPSSLCLLAISFIFPPSAAAAIVRGGRSVISELDLVWKLDMINLGPLLEDGIRRHSRLIRYNFVS